MTHIMGYESTKYWLAENGLLVLSNHERTDMREITKDEADAILSARESAHEERLAAERQQEKEVLIKKISSAKSIADIKKLMIEVMTDGNG